MFSIIMPLYNGEAYIRPAIDSVLQQTCGDYELLIVDDGSSDNSCSIVREYCNTNSKIKLLCENHGGVSHARNVGIENAAGEYVMFMDCDDTWDSSLLYECKKSIQRADSDLLIFGIRHDFYTAYGTLHHSTGEMCEGEDQDYADLRDIDNGFFQSYNIASPCNKVYKREIIIDKHIRFNTDCVMLEDLVFNLEYLTRIDSIRIIMKNLYQYRLWLDVKQSSKRHFKEIFKNADILFDKAKEFSTHCGKISRQLPALYGMVFSLYLTEYAYWTDTCGQEKKLVLDLLVQNTRFRELLRNKKGKYAIILRTAMAMRCKKLQITLLDRRK